MGSPKTNAPILRAESGRLVSEVDGLLRLKTLSIAQVIDVLEGRRCWRQIRRIQEQDVEVVVTGWRTIHGRTTLENAGVVFRVIHADQRPIVVQRFSPTFQVAEE